MSKILMIGLLFCLPSVFVIVLAVRRYRVVMAEERAQEERIYSRLKRQEDEPPIDYAAIQDELDELFRPLSVEQGARQV